METIMTRGEQLIQVLIEAEGESEHQEALEALTAYVQLVEGWYPFDQRIHKHDYSWDTSTI